MKKVAVFALIVTLLVFSAACAESNASTVTSIEDLETATIGVQRGTTGHFFAEESFPNATIDAFPEGADAIMALTGGSVDAVVIDNLPAARFVFHNEGLKVLGEYLTTEEYGIAFQLGSAYTALFDEALDTLRTNGTLDAIYDYWITENPDASRYNSPAGTEHPNGVLRMATSAGFEPFEFFEGGQIVGFDVDVANAIGDLLGYRIEVINMDFDAIIAHVQTGQADFGMAGMTIREDRREFVDFSQGYFTTGLVTIVRGD